MKTVRRDIVGAFIFSADNKVLLGYNKKGGVYEQQLVVPGGGIEEGETLLEALAREVREETGIDILQDATVTHIAGVLEGTSEKTDREGNRVMMNMTFNDFEVRLKLAANDVRLIFDDDYCSGRWFTSDALVGQKIGPATRATLMKLGFLEG